MCSNGFDGIIDRVGVFQQCFPLFWGQWNAFFAWFHFAVLFVKLTATPYNETGKKQALKIHMEIFSFRYILVDQIKCGKILMAYRMSIYVFPMNERTVTWRFLPKSNLYSPSSGFFAFLAGVRCWKKNTKFHSIPLHNGSQSKSTAQIHFMQKEIKNYKLTSSGPESLSDDSDAAAAFFFGMIQTNFLLFSTTRKKPTTKIWSYFTIYSRYCFKCNSNRWYQINQLTTKNTMLWCWEPSGKCMFLLQF